jgi:putative ABC transport system permease protein
VDSTTPAPKVYRPLLPTDVEPVTIALRIRGLSPDAFTNRLREVTIATNPMLRLQSIKSLDQTLHDNSVPQSLTILALELVTMSTVLLSAAGIYALMAFTITRRRREIGIRSALGAGPRRVLMSVLSKSFSQIAVGILIGISFAGLVDHLLDGGWTGRRGTLVLPAVAALMAAVGLIAAIGPATRALRIQPTEALKSE